MAGEHISLGAAIGIAALITSWGLPKGSADRLDEKVLYTQGKSEEQIAAVKARAALDGWHSFPRANVGSRRCP